MALTLTGWREAVAAEVQLQGMAIWAVLGRAQRNADGLYTLTYQPHTLRRGQDSRDQVRVDEDLENAVIEHAPRTGTPECWTGQTVLVLRDSSELVVRQMAGNRPPASGDAFRIYPHNYLLQLRDWLDTTDLPEALDQRLAARCRLPSPWLSDLHVDGSLRKRQREALGLAGKAVAVLWGPPGTGKTHTLAHLAAALVRAGKRVLLLAPTRVAADTATLSIDAALDSLGHPRRTGQVLRTDLPELYAAFEQRGSHLLAWANADRRWQQSASRFHKEKARLQSERSRAAPADLPKLDADLARLRDEHDAARSEYKKHQDELVADAAVVCATIRQNQSKLWHSKFDQVLVDEASMVSVSDAMHLLVTGATPTIFAGDHKQLGPISQAAGRGRESTGTQPAAQAARLWLGRSILDHLDAERIRLGVPRVMLDEQSRMNAELCQVVSTLMYEGQLRAVNPPTAGLPPHLPAGICVLDSDAPPRWLPPVPDLGRAFDTYTSTARSAAAAVGLARHLVSQGHSVLVAAPYRAQAALLRRGVGDLGAMVRAGTVHRLQGQEADVAIYDPTKPHQYWADKSPEAPLMLNVAASRARHAFVLCNGMVWLERSELLRVFLRFARRVV